MAEQRDHFVASTVDWQAIVDALHEGVAVIDTRGRIIASNRAAAAMLGRAQRDIVGRTPSELELAAVAEDGTELRPEEYPSALARRTGAPVRERVIGVRAADGQRRWVAISATPVDEVDRPAEVVLTFHDVTRQRGYEAELRRLAEVDDLTGLPNRRAFLGALADHLASRRRDDSRGALLVLDLDRFKELNDTLGHVVGDRMLVHAAHAMEDRLRSTDVLGRLGGDEFAVLLPGAGEREAQHVADALAARLRQERVPTTQGGTRPLSASIGVVPLSGAAGASVDRALQGADDAMYAAKSAAHDVWQVSTARPVAPEGAVQMGVQLAKRARQLALANALGARLHEMTDIDEIAEATVEELHRAFGYHMCAVIRVRSDEHVDALAVRGSPFVALAMREWSQPLDEGVIGRCLRERTPVLVNDVRASREYAVTPETADVRAELVAPLLVDGVTWGAINLEELVEDAFDDDDSQLVCIVANQVAAAIRTAELTARLERVAR
jgi:diguanylate cyclase (GGDEF)-like protein/PAS domain S-box-containing protein